MKGYILTLIAVFLFVGLSAQIISSYDVQYTTDTSTTGGLSQYNGQTVTVEGLVVAEKYYTASSTTNYGFFLSDDVPGPFTGLFVFTNQYHPMRGDRVQVTGTVTEYNNFTELASVSAMTVISQGNALPTPITLTTGQLLATDAEKWESVFAKVENVQIGSTPSSSYGEFLVNDGSGACQIDDQCFPRGYVWSGINVGETWVKIQGVVDWGFGYYGLNPRDLSDMVKTESLANCQIQIENTNAVLNELTTVNVLTSKVKPEWGVQSYQLSIKIDPTKVLFHGLDIAQTLTPSMPEPTVSAAGDTITFTVYYQEMLVASTDGMVLIKLILEPLSYGQTLVDLISFKYDNTVINGINDGTLMTKIQERMAYLNIGKDGDNKNIFNPYMNEKITIQYGVKTGYLAKAIVRIYDAQGRLVFTPVHTNITAPLGIQSLEWNGRDANMNRLPVGMYYCHLEVTDRSTGESERTVQPIVIKSRLK